MSPARTACALLPRDNRPLYSGRGRRDAFLPDIPGIDHAITSNEAFHIEDLPRSIVIVGGGYIAVEFAGIFNGLGVETSLVYRGGEIMRGFDDELRAHLHQEMVKKGVTIKTDSDIAALRLLTAVALI